jgi:hypothetical protein
MREPANSLLETLIWKAITKYNVRGICALNSIKGKKTGGRFTELLARLSPF